MPVVEYAKLGSILCVVVLLFGGGYYVRGLSCQAALDRSHAAQLSALATAWQNRELTYEGQTQRYVNENETLRNTRAQPLPGTPLRVCFNAPSPAVPSSATGGAGPATAGTLPRRDGGVHPGDGDQRPGLFAIADEADNLLRDCRRTQPVK